MLQAFHLVVAYVATAIHACFKCLRCFRRMLRFFHLNVAYVAMSIHVCFKCFIYFWAYVASVLFGCFKCRYGGGHIAKGLVSSG